MHPGQQWEEYFTTWDGDKGFLFKEVRERDGSMAER